MLVPFILIGFAAQLIDGALGMAFGQISSTMLITTVLFYVVARWKWRWNPRPSARVSQSVVRHHYDRMLNLVARQGFKKEEPDTPYEFQTEVQRDAAPIGEEVAIVTDSFCKTFYGEKALSKSELAATEQALKRLKDRCSP